MYIDNYTVKTVCKISMFKAKLFKILNNDVYMREIGACIALHNGCLKPTRRDVLSTFNYVVSKFPGVRHVIVMNQ